MRRLFYILLILMGCISAHAQQYNNEWIDYSKTYYKFKVGATGLYRIPQSVLAASNLASVDVSQFQLWRNGVEVPLFTSAQNGALPTGGYIEFWGEANDGKADLALYRTPNDQINNSKSLFTDTAAYFLTVNPVGNNRRLIPSANNISSGDVPEKYFLFTTGIYPNESIHLGPYFGSVSEATYSASFEGAEGWTSNEITENTTRTFSLTNLFPYQGSDAPNVLIKMNVVGNSYNNRFVNMKLNNSEVFNSQLDYFSNAKLNKTVASNIFAGTTESISVSNVSNNSNNRIKVASIELTYPRTFNFGGASIFKFSLNASSSNRYLEINNFVYSGIPVLYDLKNGKRYEGNVSNPALIKFNLPSSGDIDLLLVNEDISNVKLVTGLEFKTFVDYLTTANQGDYLIITHPNILFASDASQPVEEYRAYRSAVQGGGYNAKVYMMDQLVDQFAFGIKQSPLAIRNFVRLARNKFQTSIKSVFLIGKGVKYVSARMNESLPLTNQLNLVPTFGEPASDVLLTAEGSSSVPLTPIGRVSVINGDELAIYLAKVKQYETEYGTNPQVEASLWKKNIIHMVGAYDQSTIDLLYGSLNDHKRIISDTFWGANVTDYVKNTANGSQQALVEKLTKQINSGVGMLTYFGHSNSDALAFSLEDPNNYSNYLKYPVFNMLGCNVGDIFILSENRLNNFNTISEKYLLAKNRGSIAMMAGTTLGYISPLDVQNEEFYKLVSNNGYGRNLGEIMKNLVVNVFERNGGQNNLLTRIHCEDFVLNGDPALKLYEYNKPDFAIEENMIRVNPDIITVAESHFELKAKINNLGKAVNSKLIIELKRTFPDFSTKLIKRDTILGIRYEDSITYNIQVNPLIDRGANKFTITIDPENSIDELYKSNNSITKEVYIYEDDIKPIYPFNYSVINNQNIKFSASTANPFAESRTYLMELDTTEKFNSPFKISLSTVSKGGLIEFKPSINYIDSTVYFWRVASTGPENYSQLLWNKSSFTFLSGTDNIGYNQSGYYHFKDIIHDSINMLKNSQTFIFDSVEAKITVNNAFIQAGAIAGYNSLQIDGIYIQQGWISSPNGNPQQNSLRFYLINNRNLQVVKNKDLGKTGMYGSYSPIPLNPRIRTVDHFQFDISTPEARKLVMNFLDSIPEDYYVGMSNNLQEPSILPNVWKSDTAIFGSGISLYHKLRSLGLNYLDSINQTVPYAFIYQKGNSTPLAQVVGFAINQKLHAEAVVKVSTTSGVIRSSVLNRAKSWNKLVWDGYSLEIPSSDSALVSVIGVDKNGNRRRLIEDVPVSEKMINLSTISISEYPGLLLELHSYDPINRTPYQLKYWRVYADPVPEGAVAPNLFISRIDTLEAGQPLNFGIAFKNVSSTSFDSISIKATIRDKNNKITILPVPKQCVLISNDTLKFELPINTSSFGGENQLYLEFNPENAQPEQFQFNNFLFINFFVRSDSLNPYLDVTFDGVHILNKDIVSSKPDIQIKLTDEAKYLLLNSTSLVKVQMRLPNGQLQDYNFNSDTLMFIPPGQAGNSENTATINFKPHLMVDGEYELIVSGKDESGNKAGDINYRISFQVINKPMISNLLNYPNPFTSSTAFVFTLTGSEVPQNIRIQILTITGKIVREITKAELGPLQIGRNITEFKWDGTDQYGQKLANGVYLYRVLTNQHGKALDKYTPTGDNTDRYFNKGYGKMVLIR